MAEAALKQLTYDDYLAVEAASPERHIFWRGEIFAMAGGTPDHAMIQANLITLLNVATSKGPCYALGSDLRLRHEESEDTVYPDVQVICGPMQMHPEDRNAATNPTVVFEVLSPSTESVDRGDNRGYYMSFTTLRTVVLVFSKTMRVERYTRQGDGSWSLRVHGADDVVSLPEIGASLLVSALYQRTSLAQAAVEPESPPA